MILQKHRKVESSQVWDVPPRPFIPFRHSITQNQSKQSYYTVKVAAKLCQLFLAATLWDMKAVQAARKWAPRLQGNLKQAAVCKKVCCKDGRCSQSTEIYSIVPRNRELSKWLGCEYQPKVRILTSKYEWITQETALVTNLSCDTPTETACSLSCASLEALLHWSLPFHLPSLGWADYFPTSIDGLWWSWWKCASILVMKVNKATLCGNVHRIDWNWNWKQMMLCAVTACEFLH